ncbi:MAG: pilus assembly protein TadG-related protein [Stagnimonas sp.]|nr:pilus assembly protein TadG-related protein [Stagnimonas sp.]
MRHARHAAAKNQRGFAAVFAAIAMIAMLSAVALSIDIGRLYTAKRDLQKLANLAALDAVRVASGCSVEAGGAPGGASEATAEATASVQRNASPSVVEDIDVTVEVGRRVPLAQTGALQTFEVLPTASPLRDAVRVRLSRPAPSRIIPGITGAATTQLVAYSVVAQPALGKLSIGSDTASLNNGVLNSVLGGLLCPTGNAVCQAQVVALNVAGSGAVLNASVTLGQLATALNVTVKDLSDPVFLSTQTPVLSDVLNGLAGAVSGTASAGVSTLLTSLALAAQGNTDGVPLAQLLRPVTDIVGEVPFVGLLDLIISLGQSGKAGQPAIALNLPVNIPNVTSIYTFLRVVEPPQMSGMEPAGQARASTAQVRLQLRLQLDLLHSLTTTLNPLLLGLATIEADPVRLGIDVDVAKAEAFLDALQCPRLGVNNGMPTAAMSVRTALADVDLGTFAGNGADAPPITPGPATLLALRVKVLFGVASANISVGIRHPVSTSGGGETQQLDLVTQFQPLSEQLARIYVADGAPGAPPSSDNPQQAGNENILSSLFSSLFGSLSSELTTDADGPSQLCVLFVCLPISGLLDPILSVVTSALGAVLSGVGGIVDALLDPLLNALGVEVGNATVTLQSVEMPQPAVVNTVVEVLTEND